MANLILFYKKKFKIKFLYIGKSSYNISIFKTIRKINKNKINY